MYERASLFAAIALTLALPVARAATPAPPAGAPVVEINAADATIKAAAPVETVSRPVWRGNTLRARFRNESFAPVTATLRITGLKPGIYDLYVSGTFEGSHASDAMASGLPVKMSEGLMKPGLRKALEAYETLLPGAAEMMDANRPAWPFWGEYAAYASWVDSLLVEDRGQRSVSVSIVEKDRPTQPGMSGEYLSREALAARCTELIQDLERLRKRVVQKKFGAEKEARHLGWLVPLRVTIDQTAAVASGQITVTVENQFDSPVKGLVKLSGAKAAPASCDISLPAGGTKVCTFKAESVSAAGNVSAVVTGMAGAYRFRQDIKPPAPAAPAKPAEASTYR